MIMAYIEGFVIPVPKANRDKFIEHARSFDAVFIENGAQSVLECWAEDVPHGKQTDFYGAVDATPDEAIVFGWIEWPDKATRTVFHSQMDQLTKTDTRFDPAKHPAPFDGKRMVFGGFVPIVERGEHTSGSYVQGFVIPVPADMKEAYRKMADDAWAMFKGLGALRVVEAWDDDVPEGKVTDLRRAVKAGPDEKVVFSFMEWPSREVCDTAHDAMIRDDLMQMPDVMPFDSKRMVYGGFSPVVELQA
jgi:uncharacterized protein YbaA (DUF1428 family)